MNIYSKNILWFLSLLLITGCATSYLTSSHSNIDGNKHYNKIAVLAKSKNQALRSDFEQHITEQLVAYGINAVTSTTLIPHSAITNDPTEAELESLRLELVSKGIDGIIITSLVDKQDFVEVLPDTEKDYPFDTRDYGSGWELTSDVPDRFVSGVEYYLESALYDITSADDNLDWVANFKVKELDTVDVWAKKFAAELSKALVDEQTGIISTVN